MWLDVERTIEEIARFSSRRRRRLSADARRVRRGEGGIQLLSLHADRVRAFDRRALAGHPARSGMAPSQCHVGMGCDPARVREPAHPGLHVVDGVHDLTADRLAGIGLSRLLPRGGSSAKELVGPARRVRQPAPGPVAALEAYGGAVVTDTLVTSLITEDGRCVGVETEDGSQYRARVGVVSSIHVKDPGRHGARRDVGRGLPLRGRHLRRRPFVVRLLLRRHRSRREFRSSGPEPIGAVSAGTGPGRKT